MTVPTLGVPQPGAQQQGPNTNPVAAISNYYQQQQQDTTQQQAQADLATQASQQANIPAPPPVPDKSKGWSLNPFQDLGQIWHDVETHTVAPAFHAAHWLFHNAITRPYNAVAIYDAENQYQATQGKPNWSWFQSSLWGKAWTAGNTMTMGQATVLAANNDPLEQQIGPNSRQDLGARVVDPLNHAQVIRMTQDPTAPNAYSNRMLSGTVDVASSWYLDPMVRLSKGIKTLKAVKDAPILTGESEASRVAKIDSPRGVAFDNWAVGKPLSVLAEHPMVKGTVQANPLRYQAAALMAGAKSAEEINLIRKVMGGVPGAITGVTTQAGDINGAAKTLDKLASVNRDTASQVSNLVLAPEVMEKYALSASSADEKEQFLQKASKLKAQAAQDDVNMNADKAQRLLDLAGVQRGRTATTAVANRLAEVRGNLKYANTRDTDARSFMHNAFYNYPIRIYQGLTDRAPGLINHRDDQAVEYAKAWLNKSSALAPEDKTTFLQQYASATPGDRAHVWQQIEQDVYDKVGDKYGIDPNDMKRILTTTRSRQANFIQYARSKSYGGVKIGDTENAVLPSPDDQVVLHPKYITQLEAGAVPVANLHNLENALEALDRKGTLGNIVNFGYRSGDTLSYLLDKVYGIWKPLALMTGHRAYNHIGDDWLRGLAKLGGLTTVQNAAEGTSNFLRNRYAQASRNVLVRNVSATHEAAMGDAKAQYEGLLAQYKDQRASKYMNGAIPEDLRITPAQLADKKSVYDQLRKMQLDFIQPKHRLGEGTFKIAGSNIDWPEVFGGPNGDWARRWTSSHPTFDSMVNDGAHNIHSQLTAIRTSGFGTISAVDDVAKHTMAYTHYVRNQMMPDPVAKQIVNGTPLTDVARWLTNSAAGRSHMKDLHIGDARDWVDGIAEDVKTFLPSDTMREAASKGKFNADLIEREMPNAAMRPDVSANIGGRLYGGDQSVNYLKRTTDTLMRWTGTLPDDIMVRHPVFNSMYKNRLSESVQDWMGVTGKSAITTDDVNRLINSAMLGARKDMQGLLYDVSRFNDLGHTLRFVSPFFNAWFNAMSSWSKLFIQNPGLLGRTYEAKRLLWNSGLAVNSQTGQKADESTPWDQTAFVVHAPKGLFGGLTTIPIDAKTLISPTYVDSIGNPGFGPIVAMPVNHFVKDHPEYLNNELAKMALGGFVDKNDLQALIPSSARDINGVAQLLTGSPSDNTNYAKTTWAIYQEQYYDYLNGQRTAKPQMSDVENQAKYLTLLDYFVNRLSPLGFKPAPEHQFFVNEYRTMQTQDPKNAKQNFYDKYGPAAMMFTQSLSTDPSGIPATVGASIAVKKYGSILSQFPELGSVIVGPEGNGNFDDLAYQWQVANGFRKALSPAEAATQAQINIGWAQYGQARSAVQAQLQAQGLKSLNDPQARSLKLQMTQFVNSFGDRNSPNYNPDFYSNFTSFNQNAYQERMGKLLQIAQDPKLLANPVRSDIRSLAAYAQVRDTTYAMLQQQPVKTITSAANFQIAQWYDTQVSQLIADDTKFGQLYERYLAKDDWKNPA